jgi:hypothetical protein
MRTLKFMFYFPGSIADTLPASRNQPFSQLTRETLNVRCMTLSRHSLVSLGNCFAKG